MRRFLLTLSFFASFGLTPSFSQQFISRESAIRDHLTNPKHGFGLRADDLSDLQITDDYRSHNADWDYVYLRQQVNGRPVVNTHAVIVMDGLTVLYAKPALIKDINEIPVVEDASIAPVSALRSLAEYAGVELNVEPQISAAEKFELNDASLSEEPIRFQLSYLYRNKKLELIWHLNWYLVNRSHWYDAYVSAETGEILETFDWVMECSFDCAVEHVHGMRTTSAPSVQEAHSVHAINSYEVFPVPVESPNHGIRVVVVDPADADASPYGWHDIDGTEGAEFTTTRGNNVRARDDRDNNNTGGLEVDGGTDLEFSAPFDKDQPANLYLEAAIINLFYWNNIMHDVWYHYGFDEAAGNFQENNYGRGGVGSDYVNADAQDGSGSNNANFATPPDGQNPRMQMFLWQASSGNGDYFQVNSPSGIAGKYLSVQSAFGPRLNRVPVTGKLVLVDDGSSNPTEACQPLQNASEVNGNIALIDRGDCQFVQKISYAQAAGARAVVMVNNVAGSPIPMGGSSAGINIPAVMITMNDGQTLKNIVQGQTINVSLYDSTGNGVTILDSDFDNGVIAHEYTHGISIRLTGGPSQNCLTGNEQMGEGWSDFLALVMTHAPGAKGEDRRGIGTYVTNEPTTGGGIRPYPYSTSRSINPVTYDYIKQPQFTIPHGVGSVWCSMLWDLYWAFIDRYGYDADLYKGKGGNNMVMLLVMDGLKLQGCNPGFVDGRDAILAADRLRYGGANQRIIWEVFAARGLGYSASQGSSASKTDGVEAFDLPPALLGFDFVKSGVEQATAGDTIPFTLFIKNLGEEALTNLEIKDTLPSNMAFVSDDGVCPVEQKGTTLIFRPGSVPVGDSITCRYIARIERGIGGEILWTDDVENGEGNFEKMVDNGGGNWIRLGLKPRSGQYSWFINNPGSASDRSLITELDLTNMENPYFSFQHDFETEDGWDGAVVEIGDGNSWTDLGGFMIENGYNNRIQNNPASAISDRDAFSGNSQGFINTVIDLGMFKGAVHKLRFRFVSDGLQGATGWYLDDFKLWENYLSLENRATAKATALPELHSRTSTIVEFREKDTTKNDTTVVVLPDTLKGLMIFPNPVYNSELNIQFTGKEGEVGNVDLYDMAGRILWKGKIRANKAYRIPLEDQASGIYLLNFRSDTIEHVEKIYYVR
ncbi:MAG: T9SS-dependent M36 family metallopeptidase [Flavobacteriales bacterium]|nr:T9SS-dependent M36 family metallopeptidase [Flavobacteriales bacterium]